MPNLKPTLKTISIRLPEIMIEELKLIANKRDIPYQSLMKMFLAERVEQELYKQQLIGVVSIHLTNVFLRFTPAYAYSLRYQFIR